MMSMIPVMNSDRYNRNLRRPVNLASSNSGNSKIRQLPSIRSTTGVNFTSSKKLNRSKSLESINNVSAFKNFSQETLTPRQSSTSKYNKACKSIYPTNVPSQPGRFSYGYSKSLPASGGSITYREGYSGNYSENTQPLVLPQLYVRSSYDSMITPRPSESRATYVMDANNSSSENKVSSKSRRVHNVNKSKLKKSPIEGKKNLLYSGLNKQKSVSNEQLSASGSTENTKRKQITYDGTERRLAPLNLARNSQSTKELPNTKPKLKSGKENLSDSKSQTQNVDKRRALQLDSPTIKTQKRNNFNKYSRYSDCLQEGKSTNDTKTPNNKTESSTAVPVTLVGRTLTSTSSKTTAWADEQITPHRQIVKYPTVDDLNYKKVKPKLTRNLTYDVIDSKMVNLPVINSRHEKSKLNKKNNDKMNRPRFASR